MLLRPFNAQGSYVTIYAIAALLRLYEGFKARKALLRIQALQALCYAALLRLYEGFQALLRLYYLRILGRS